MIAFPETGKPYTLMLVAGVVMSLLFWNRAAKRDRRLIGVYLGALTGAFFGAKVIYLLAEGWMFWSSPYRWQAWLTGKSILGALLGGYAGVKAAKWINGFSSPTGDLFATVAPGGIILGRIGCLIHGCCLGRVCDPAWYTMTDRRGFHRWPAVPVEIAFNVLALIVLLALRRARRQQGQLFHLYLIAYGIFRFVHEWMRDTPRLGDLPVTGYQIAALAVMALGIAGYLRRARLCGSRSQDGYVPCPSSLS